MKRLCLVLMILSALVFVAPMFAADQPLAKSLTFQWEQPVDLAYINGWSLYWSPTAGSGYEKVVDIPYVAGSGPTFTTFIVLNVTGAPDATVNKYFVLTANGTNGLASVYSNEVSYGFVIPRPAPAAPFIIKITVTVGP
jgi:hypothetical protein